MRSGPDIARLAALLGDPARANIMAALMGGKALTASELAGEAGVTAQTASSHLAKLEAGGLISPRKQGRHRYYAIASEAAAHVVEALMGFATAQGQTRTRTGPKDQALRKARVCYNHLAGEAGVQLFESLTARYFVSYGRKGLSLTDAGAKFIGKLGVDVAALEQDRVPLCRECLDWSERRSHLAGSLGRALFAQMLDKRWLRRDTGSRAVHFSPNGARAFALAFPQG